MGIFEGVKALFGFSGVADTALNIVNKVAGTDWTAAQKADWILQYQEATKHQSPMRRVIAAAICLMWFLLCLTWLVSTILGRFLYDEALNPGTTLSADISAFMSLNINENFALILAFYFGVAAITGLKAAVTKKSGE